MVTRIGGLASGMDIDSIVEKLMQAERAPLYKLQQKKTSYEWQRDAYRNLNTKLKTFDTYLFDNFALSSNFVKKATTITGANKDKLTISATSGASASLNIESVTSLAKAATSGAKTVQQTTHRNAKGSDTLQAVGIVEAGETKSFNLKVNGEDKSFTVSDTDTVEDFVQNLKNAGFANASYSEATGKFSLGSTEVTVEITNEATVNAFKELGFTTSYSASPLKVGDDLASKSSKLSEVGNGISLSNLSYTLNGEAKSIDFSDLTSDSTIDDVLAKINDESTGLVASFNEKTGKFSIAGKGTNKFEVADSSRESLSSLGVQQTAGGASVAFNEVQLQAGEASGTATSNTILKHLGILEDGKFKLSTVQANGSMKETVIEFKATDTIDSLMKKINNSGAGVTALFSQGQMSLSANNTGTNKAGASADIQLSTEFMVNGSNTTDTAGFNLFKTFGFAAEASTDKDGNVVSNKFDLSGKGSNAEYTVNGLTLTSQTNSISLQGYSIQLNGTFNDGTGVSVSASNDVDTMMSKIKEFVSTYNGLVTDLNTSLKETKYRDYTPLTAEQKEEMSESEIKLWEEKAKSGLLRNDSIVRDGLSKMRATFPNAVGGLGDKTIDSLAEIGITTSSKISDGGTLVINETKLRAALEKNPDQVAQIFIKNGKAGDTETDPVTGTTKKVDSRGLVQRLRDSIDAFELNIEKKAGRSTMTDHQYNIGKSMLDLDTRIERLQDRLVSVEQRYWKQFTAMEQAISKANQQSGMFFSGQTQ